ncbi:MAG TPA: prepilin peptidase [Pseudonocardia sp.]|jgi:leader peptidase (prepilin peptidase)/N-methyltransferase|nr:prepilin peptidase [Pseudonocardia sp.]
MAQLVFFGGLGMLGGALARWLLGRLRRGTVVSPPHCELVLGALWAVSGYWWSVGRLDPAWLPLLLGLGWLAVAAGAVDLVHGRLPDALTLPALPAALLLAVPLGGGAVARAALGAAALGGGYLVVRLVVPTALGAGDVKLAAPLGAALGAVSWPAVLVGALLASLLTVGLAVAGGLVEAVVARAARVGTGGTGPVGRRSVGRRSAGWRSAGWPRWGGGVPHGPPMLAAGWLVLAAAGTGGALLGT